MVRRTVGLLAVALITGAGIAEAGGPPPLANARVVDPATGATVTTRVGAPGTASFEVATGRLTIHKDVWLGRSVTVISEGSDRLAITIDRAAVGVATNTDKASALLVHPEGIERVVRVLGRSQAAKDAASLLGRVRFDGQAAAGQAFAFTTALLESVEGNQDGTRALVSSVRPAKGGARAVEARVGPTPGECWDLYSKDAIRVANEYLDCYNNTSWYDFLDRLGCATLYDVQAEGDWLWYLNCIGSPLPQVRVG